MINAPFWANLNRVCILTESSYTSNALSKVCTQLFSKTPLLTVLEIETDCIRSASIGLSMVSLLIFPYAANH